MLMVMGVPAVVAAGVLAAAGVPAAVLGLRRWPDHPGHRFPDTVDRAHYDQLLHRRGVLAGAAVLAALVGGVTAVRSADGWALVTAVVLTVMGALLTVTDLAWHLLPDRVLGPATVLVLLIGAGDAVTTGTARPLAAGVLSAAYAGGLFLVMFLLGPPGQGLGDAKLVAVLALSVGHAAAVAGGSVASPLPALGLVLAGLLIGTVHGGIARLVTRRSAPFPLGPALLAGALVVALAGS